MKLIDVRADNVDQTGFFCQMTKKRSPGYQAKLAWLRGRFAEGLRIKMLDLAAGGRGFIEYIPGEYAWRPVYAAGYLFIHCLWVVGQSRGHGYASQLLEECECDARASGARGVAMLTSERIWLLKQRFLLNHGYRSVAQAPPSFNLMVKQFAPGPEPALPTDWEARAARYGNGVTVVYADQCPYIADATRDVLQFAQSRGIPARTVELTSSQQIREEAPSAYGVFQILWNGRLLSYYYLLPKDLDRLLGSDLPPSA